MITQAIPAPRFTCEGCEDAVRAARGGLSGGYAVHPDAGVHAVVVAHDPATTSETTIRAVLTDVGYPPAEPACPA